MKERPILFSGPMVKAILEDRKGATRRVRNLEPVNSNPNEWKLKCLGKMKLGKNGEKRGPFSAFFESQTGDFKYTEECSCPWGEPGDRIWARETWRPIGWNEGEPIYIEYQDGKKKECDPCAALPGTDYESWEERIIEQACEECEKAGCETTPGGSYFWEGKCPIKWRPSIHMPRWASRILLEIADIRVERLQDITDEDAKSEGVFFKDYGRMCFHKGSVRPVGDCTAPENTHPKYNGWSWKETSGPGECLGSARFGFANLWNHVNGVNAWEANPWVWVVEFKRVEIKP